MLYMLEEAHHAPQIQALHQQLFTDPQRDQRASAQLRRQSPALAPLCLVASHEPVGSIEGSIRGHAVWAGHRAAALISPLAVSAKHQGNGVSHELMARFTDLSERLGLSAIVLKASTPQAARFYEKKGFLPMSESGLKWPAQDEAQDAMVFPLNGHTPRNLQGPVRGWNSRAMAPVCRYLPAPAPALLQFA